MVGLLKSDKYSNTYTLISFWIKFLSFVDFIDEPPVSDEMKQYLLKLGLKMYAPMPEGLTPIDAVRIAVFKVFEDSASWNDICKTYILVNVITENPAAAVTRLFDDRKLPLAGSRSVASGVQVATHLMGCRNASNEHQETLTTLLTTYMRVDVPKVKALLQENDNVAEIVQQSLKA
eukprot:1483459-Rhodomonas_salina.1